MDRSYGSSGSGRVKASSLKKLPSLRKQSDTSQLEDTYEDDDRHRQDEEEDLPEEEEEEEEQEEEEDDHPRGSARLKQDDDDDIDLDELLREGEEALAEGEEREHDDDHDDAAVAWMEHEDESLSAKKSRAFKKSSNMAFLSSLWGRGISGLVAPEPAEEPEIQIDGDTTIKTAVEILLESKVQQHRRAAEKFKRDFLMLLAYLPFLIVVSIVSLRVDQTVVFNARRSIEQSLLGVSTFGSFEDFSYSQLSSVNDIYTFLDKALIPAISVENLTTIDARCTFTGANVDLACSYTAGTCCDTALSTPSTFVTGGNIMMTTAKIRQMRVIKNQVNLISGGTITGYPPLSPSLEETREGAGTTSEWDPQGEYYDWPADKEWFPYTKCVKTGVDSCYVPDDFAYYSGRYSRNGFVAELNGTTSNMRAQVAELQKHRFFSPFSTRAVFVDFSCFLGNRRLFAVVTVLFEITEFGDLIASKKIIISDLHQGLPAADLVMEYVVFGYAMVLMILDVIKFYLQGLVYWTGQNSGWHVISWVNYVLFIAGLALRIILQVQEDKIKNFEPLSPDSQSYPWQEVASNEQILQFLNSVNALLTWLRLIKHVEAISPRTRQLTLTIIKSAGDLSTLSLLFFIVYMGYSFAFYVAFGAEVQSFSRIADSLGALFQAVLGEFDFSSLLQVSRVLAPIMFVSYILIVYFLMLNMILAVVMKTYSEVSDYLNAESTAETTGVGLLRKKLKDTFHLLKAHNLEEIREIQRGKQPVDEPIRTETDVLDREHITVRDIEILFKEDPEVLDRLQVNSFGELIYVSASNNDGKIPTAEVREVMLKDPLEERKKKEADTLEHKKMMDQSERIQKNVEESMQKALAKQKGELEAFIQLQISNMTLVLSHLKNDGEGYEGPPPVPSSTTPGVPPSRMWGQTPKP